MEKLKSIVESLIFVSEEPLSIGALTLILEPDGVSRSDIEAVLESIRTEYNDNAGRALMLREVAGGFQFCTKPEFAPWIQKLDIPKPSRLSQPALETMAIIAYRQPIVRSEIEDVRGVDSGGVLKTMLERGLVKIIGKRDEAGSPLIYGTTDKFLEIFSLKNLSELPTLREYKDLENEYYKQQNLSNDAPTESLLEGITVKPFAEKWDKEDDALMSDIDSGLKGLRRLEKEIFPKPVETLVAVPNQIPADTAEGTINAGTEEVSDSDTSPETTG